MRILRPMKLLFHWLRVLAGSLVYMATRQTPSFAHQSMVALFCQTGGRSNDWISKVIGAFSRPYHLATADGVLGDMSDRKHRDQVVRQLRTSGYYVFESCIPPGMCDSLLEYALSHAGTVRPMDGAAHGARIRTTYSRSAPIAVRYDFDVQDLLQNSDVQTLLADL